MLIEILKLVGSGCVGGVIGACFTNWFTGHRERKKRISDFRKTISGLRAKVKRQRQDALYDLYAQSVPVVASEAVVIRRDISNDRLMRFIADADRYCLFTRDDIQAQDLNYRPTPHAPVSFERKGVGSHKRQSRFGQSPRFMR